MTAPKKKARGVRTATAESAPKIDRAKLRDALRTIGDESVFYMLDEIARIRSDDAVRAAVPGRFAHRTKVTAVVADLSDPRDAGTRKALTRIKRAIAQRGRP